MKKRPNRRFDIRIVVIIAALILIALEMSGCVSIPIPNSISATDFLFH